MNDKIADIINKLNNAGKSEKPTVVVPYSNISWAVLKILEKNGFVKTVSKKGRRGYAIEAEVAYEEDGRPKILGVKRISKSSRRVYFNARELHSVRNGFGKLVISTPEGVMTGEEAKKRKVGGEPLFIVW